MYKKLIEQAVERVVEQKMQEKKLEKPTKYCIKNLYIANLAMLIHQNYRGAMRSRYMTKERISILVQVDQWHFKDIETGVVYPVAGPNNNVISTRWHIQEFGISKFCNEYCDVLYDIGLSENAHLTVGQIKYLMHSRKNNHNNNK